MDRSTCLADWIQENGNVQVDEKGRRVAEIRVAFGRAKDKFVTDANSDIFEDTVNDTEFMTQLEIADPADEFDKKRESRATKSFPGELRNLFMKLYGDKDSPLHHGFTYEMQQAAFQLIASESSTQLSNAISEKLKFPPDDNFIERCRASTRMIKALQDYSWEQGRFPPSGTTESPPYERNWKASDAGREFLRNNPSAGRGGSSANNFDRLLNTILADRKTSSSTRTDSNPLATSDGRILQGFIRITNEISRDHGDVDFGTGSDSKMTVNSTLRDVLSKVKVHPNYERNIEERIFKVQLKKELIFYTADSARNVELGFLLETAGIEKGEILHVASGTRLIEAIGDNVNLSP